MCCDFIYIFHYLPSMLNEPAELEVWCARNEDASLSQAHLEPAATRSLAMPSLPLFDLDMRENSGFTNARPLRSFLRMNMRSKRSFVVHRHADSGRSRCGLWRKVFKHTGPRLSSTMLCSKATFLRGGFLMFSDQDSLLCFPQGSVELPPWQARRSAIRHKNGRRGISCENQVRKEFRSR